jgi:predicted metal-dependent hydrolase
MPKPSTMPDGKVSYMLHAKRWIHPSATQGIGCVWFFPCLTKILIHMLLAHELANVG